MSTASLQLAATEIVDAIDRWLEAFHTPLLVAIDGRSGAGKSALADLVASSFGAAVVRADDFFAAEVTAAEWDARTGAERAHDALDWRRLRVDALLPLLDGNAAEWHAFDFAAGQRPDGSYALSAEATRVEARPIIVLDGAYSTRSELADLAGLTVLVEATEAVRRERQAAREEATFLAEWHRRWGPAERYYFGRMRRPEGFDLVVQNN